MSARPKAYKQDTDGIIRSVQSYCQRNYPGCESTRRAPLSIGVQNFARRITSPAAALLFPIDWPEPFGLVLIEAMACGTPVIAWRCGSVAEIIEDGKTGFVVDTEEEAVRAVLKLDQLDRRRVRSVFQERFTANVMARNYLRLYWRLCGVAGTAEVKAPCSYQRSLTRDAAARVNGPGLFVVNFVQTACRHGAYADDDPTHSSALQDRRLTTRL